MPFAPGAVANIYNQARGMSGLMSPGATPGQRTLAEMITGVGQQRSALAPQVTRASMLAATGEERGLRKLGAATASRIAQDYSTPTGDFRTALSQATRKAKARRGIATRGEAAISSQSLRDRIEVVKRGTQRQGRLMQSLGSAANIRQGVNVGVQEARDFSSAARADMWGGISGSMAAFIKHGGLEKIGDIFRGPPKPIASSTTSTLPVPGTGAA